MPTYLQLAPEQGGNRFGPFPGGTIQLGSDGNRCQIALGMPGIAPVHAMILDHGNGTYTVQPAQRGLQLFLVQGNRAYPLNDAAQARHGDGIVVGGQAGPRFQLQFDDSKPQAAGRGGGNGQFAGGMFAGSAAAKRYERQGGFGNAMGNEVKRQAMAKAIGKLGLGEYYSMYYRWQSGTMLQPRYIVTALGGLAVLLGGAIVSCLGLLTGLLASL